MEIIGIGPLQVPPMPTRPDFEVENPKLTAQPDSQKMNEQPDWNSFHDENRKQMANWKPSPPLSKEEALKRVREHEEVMRRNEERERKEQQSLLAPRGIGDWFWVFVILVVCIMFFVTLVRSCTSGSDY